MMKSSMLSTHTKQGCRSSLQALTTPHPEKVQHPSHFQLPWILLALAAHMPESVCDAWGTECVGEWQQAKAATLVFQGQNDS